MEPLKAKYEAFCRYYASHPHAGTAAEMAGYLGVNPERQAYRLLRRPEIAARIAELRASQAALDSLSLPALLAKLESAYLIAFQKGDAMTAARIAEMEAKLAALFAKTGRAELDPPSAEPTRVALARIAREIGVVGPQG